MGVGLGQGGGDPEDGGGEHHRPADVPARPEDGVRAPPAQDSRTGRGRDRVARQGAEEPRAEGTRQSLDLERVEVEARAEREPLLDGVRPTGERDGRAAALQRLCDRERGQRVTGRPAGGDQVCQSWKRRHG